MKFRVREKYYFQEAERTHIGKINISTSAGISGLFIARYSSYLHSFEITPGSVTDFQRNVSREDLNFLFYIKFTAATEHIRILPRTSN